MTSKVGQHHDEIISQLFARSQPFSLKVLSEATGLFFKHTDRAKTYKCRLLSALSCWRAHRTCGELVKAFENSICACLLSWKPAPYLFYYHTISFHNLCRRFSSVKMSDRVRRKVLLASSPLKLHVECFEVAVQHSLRRTGYWRLHGSETALAHLFIFITTNELYDF